MSTSALAHSNASRTSARKAAQDGASTKRKASSVATSTLQKLNLLPGAKEVTSASEAKTYPHELGADYYFKQAFNYLTGGDSVNAEQDMRSALAVRFRDGKTVSHRELARFVGIAADRKLASAQRLIAGGRKGEAVQLLREAQSNWKQFLELSAKVKGSVETSYQARFAEDGYKPIGRDFDGAGQLIERLLDANR
jgi:hypothetical protein